MGIKVFISYSHKDESYKESLEEHLSSLKRSGKISTWNDRKIVPGNDWKNEIDDNLDSSELILFLISSAFMSSDYCVNTEARKAIDMHNEGRAILVHIFIRPCDWKEQGLDKFQGLPKDAKPVSSWQDQDEAWLDVVNGLKTRLDKHNKKDRKVVGQNNYQGDSSVSSKVYKWLDDTEVSLTHREVDRVLLGDVYVVPDIEEEDPSIGDLMKYKSADMLLNADSGYVVAGEEQQGKTSLLKYLFKGFLKKEYYPIYLDGVDINKADLATVIKKALPGQYENMTLEEFVKKENKVILIDNLDEIRLNQKYRNILLESINGEFEHRVYTCQSSFRYIFNEIPPLDDFRRFELFGLGNKNREELVRKWVSLGKEEIITDDELYPICDEIKDYLNGVIKKNVVPAKPVYILMLLQMYEAYSKLNLELTSHGHCYQQLIYQSFDNANIEKSDFNKYLNVLTELSWWIFRNRMAPNQAQLEEFFSGYCNEYLPVDSSRVIKRLLSHSILTERDCRVGFKYPYIYYFFVGKKIAESYSSSEEVRASVKNILDKLHREDFANILIFVTHHTKDNWILNDINKVLSEMFSEQRVATLEQSTLNFMDDFMKKIPDLINEKREVHKERDSRNKRMDEIERSSPEEGEVEGSTDILFSINKTFKGMEISG